MTTTRPAPGERSSIWKILYLHTWLGRIMWALGLVIVALLTAWMMARSTPGWYGPLDPNDDVVNANASRSESLFSELRNDVGRAPFGQDLTWTITQDELNSFLAVYAHLA